MSRHDPIQYVGVNEVERIVLTELNYIFRAQEKADYGIDAHIEIVTNGDPTGKLIAVQIKTGPSYFHKSKKGDSYVYRGDITHLNYWLGHSLPVILIGHLPDSKLTIWALIAEGGIERTGKAWKIKIPQSQVFGCGSKLRLYEIANQGSKLQKYFAGIKDKSAYDEDILIKKYPLGIAVFKINGRRNFITPIGSKLEKEYEIDWSGVSAEVYAAEGRRQFMIVPPMIKPKRAMASVTVCSVSGDLDKGAAFYVSDGLMVAAEVIESSGESVSFLIGFREDDFFKLKGRHIGEARGDDFLRRTIGSPKGNIVLITESKQPDDELSSFVQDLRKLLWNAGYIGVGSGVINGFDVPPHLKVGQTIAVLSKTQYLPKYFVEAALALDEAMILPGNYPLWTNPAFPEGEVAILLLNSWNR